MQYCEYGSGAFQPFTKRRGTGCEKHALLLCSVRLVAGEHGKPSAEWTGHSRWMEVTIGLIGEMGRMSAMGPTLKLAAGSDVSMRYGHDIVAQLTSSAQRRM